MASQSAGIQQLLIAEKRAAEKIDAARKRKQRRLKQAKDEAQSEVEAYRGERETAYKERETAHMGSRGDLEARIDGQTDVKLNEVDAAFQRNKDDVLKNLMDLVMDVEPQLHKNQKHFLWAAFNGTVNEMLLREKTPCKIKYHLLLVVVLIYRSLL